MISLDTDTITRASLEPVEECTFWITQRDGTRRSVHYEPTPFVPWMTLAHVLSDQLDGGRDFYCTSNLVAEFDAGEEAGHADIDIRYSHGVEIQAVDMSPRPSNLESACEEAEGELDQMYPHEDDCLLVAMRFADLIADRETAWRVLR